MASVQLQPDSPEESEEEDYDEDGDDDIDAEAQEMARRLGQELWADISRATTSDPTVTPTIDSSTHAGKAEAAIMTMKSILAFVEKDPLAHSTLASSLVPTSNGGNVLDALKHAVTLGKIQKNIAMPLSEVIVSLARSEVLFGALRHSNASSIQLDQGKRKREEADDRQSPTDSRAHKRQYVPSSDLQTQVTEAVRIITQAFGTSSSRSLDPPLVSSIRLQLHQVFLFAVTSSAGGGPDMHALQEISGLIQVVGVLSGIQIGQTPDANPPPAPTPNPTYPWLPSPTPTDIGTAVYPCLIPGCGKTFARLYSLRGHQRIHALHRPFRCKTCPASFARNHDLKRHVRLHDKKAWKCGGCLKVFSRRDAIKRHKDSSKTRGSKNGDCVDAQVLEVDIHPEDGEEAVREERRAKLWNGIAISKATAPSYLGGYRDGSQVEEGEIQASVISGIQSAVISLHGLLQAHVGNALGSPTGQGIIPPMDPSGSQATLASVIARAQLQNLPPGVNTTSSVVNHLDSNPIQSAGVQAMAADTTVKIDLTATTPIPSLSMYGLSDEQTKMLEEAIANAAAAAQAQAEAEAALEEEEEGDEDQDDDDPDGGEGQADPE